MASLESLYIQFSTHPLVEQLQVLRLRLTGSDMVEDADEYGVALTIHLLVSSMLTSWNCWNILASKKKLLR